KARDPTLLCNSRSPQKATPDDGLSGVSMIRDGLANELFALRKASFVKGFTAKHGGNCQDRA
ncbi:MAG TPA: hypothetical protein VMF90_08345, partial [Rhizobiaceae bacterium]|nr:hypothetical protein [Rhizobiaceae bacterium]